MYRYLKIGWKSKRANSVWCAVNVSGGTSALDTTIFLPLHFDPLVYHEADGGARPQLGPDPFRFALPSPLPLTPVENRGVDES